MKWVSSLLVCAENTVSKVKGKTDYLGAGLMWVHLKILCSQEYFYLVFPVQNHAALEGTLTLTLLEVMGIEHC